MGDGIKSYLYDKRSILETIRFDEYSDFRKLENLISDIILTLNGYNINNQNTISLLTQCRTRVSGVNKTYGKIRCAELFEDSRKDSILAIRPFLTNTA